MLAIGRALVTNSDILLLDEPSEGLSPVTNAGVIVICRELLKAGISILLVEHNLKVAMSLADRVYLMGKAHLGFTGTKQDLEARPDIRAKYSVLSCSRVSFTTYSGMVLSASQS